MAQKEHTWLIRLAAQADLAPFFAYLDDHLRDNGADGGPLFQPMPRGESRLPGGVRLSFLKGLDIKVGSPGWRRLWLAIGQTGDIAGHIDLRSRPEMAARHRALLGMGAHRAHRRQGLASSLIETATQWARDEAGIGWIDLEVLSENEPAVALYLRTGFTMLARVSNMLRIDGVGHDLTYMTRALR
jgi:ribosomal protein S18 acetylase RimI-like enzyme